MHEDGSFMRRVFARLFGPPNEAFGDPQTSPRKSLAIPVPEGLDPDAIQRVPAALFNSDLAQAARRMSGKKARHVAFERARAEAAGCVAYTWRTSGDEAVCEVCRPRGGLRFLYADEPEHGHAGVCRACPQGWCRCYAEPILPDE